MGWIRDEFRPVSIPYPSCSMAGRGCFEKHVFRITQYLCLSQTRFTVSPASNGYNTTHQLTSNAAGERRAVRDFMRFRENVRTTIFVADSAVA